MTALIDALVRETGLRPVDLLRVMHRAPDMYKTFEIPKRTGGFREISQPAREVKYVQRALHNILIKDLPVHECATAYRKGRSIRDNAAPHAGHRPILKFDFKNFFPSIRAADWVSYCEVNKLPLSPEEIVLTSRLLFHRRKGARTLTLAIGAPTSPSLSNALMYDFDNTVVENLENSHVVYTRYADDLTFSAPRTGYLNGVKRTVYMTVRSIRYPRLTVNTSKTTEVTTKYGRVVTGLTLSNDGRVTIGWRNKKTLHAAMYNAKQGGLDEQQLRVVSGMLAYVNAVEPAFMEVLLRKYGEETVKMVQRAVQRGSRVDPHYPPLARLFHDYSSEKDA